MNYEKKGNTETFHFDAREAVASLPRQIVQAGYAQLKTIQLTNDNDYLRRDIQGYEEVLKMSDDTIRAFLETKDKARRSLTRFEDNLAVIKHLKEKGKWL